MSRIRLLPDIVASQVAAGEVVERPASVVKELIENSIDAGARKIEILIRRGGISLVRVVDDGCGMDRDDALLSLERHATSKIRSAADLQAVSTLGFRGEALPSIASVSRFRLTTREPNALAGTEIIVNGGKIDIVRDGGEAPGTQVEVRSLFFNVPARRKVQIRGFIGQAGLSRQTRAQQLIFVNGRAIDSGLITSAIREGYHTALMKGQYPVTFLFLDLDPATVDVNVHPAKREVRFRDPNAVREVIVRCIQQSLERGRTEWQEKFRAPLGVPAGVPGKVAPNLRLRPEVSAPEESNRELPHLGSTVAGVVDPGRAIKTHPPPSPGPVKRDGDRQQFQIIGVLNKLYVLMENADGLVLVDQHAAHERILFEELRRRMEEQG